MKIEEKLKARYLYSSNQNPFKFSVEQDFPKFIDNYLN